MKLKRIWFTTGFFALLFLLLVGCSRENLERNPYLPELQFSVPINLNSARIQCPFICRRESFSAPIRPQGDFDFQLKWQQLYRLGSELSQSFAQRLFPYSSGGRVGRMCLRGLPVQLGDRAIAQPRCRTILPLFHGVLQHSTAGQYTRYFQLKTP